MKTTLLIAPRSATFLAAMLAAVLSTAAAGHPLEGLIWDSQSHAFVGADSAYRRAAASRYVLLGEQHDSALQHDLQLQALQELARRGRRPALAMEQFDHEWQAPLSAAQAAGVLDPERLADAGQLRRKEWRWPLYRDLIGFAASHGWPLLAANLSRADARAIALGQASPALAAIDAAQTAALEDDIVRGHCGQRPPRLTAIVAAQRARDAQMAAVLDSATGPVVLIAGAGHVRRTRAVPHYLKDNSAVLSIAYVEVDDDKLRPEAYDAEGFDLLWFSARTARPESCAEAPGGTVSGSIGGSISVSISSSISGAVGASASPTIQNQEKP